MSPRGWERRESSRRLYRVPPPGRDGRLGDTHGDRARERGKTDEGPSRGVVSHEDARRGDVDPRGGSEKAIGKGDLGRAESRAVVPGIRERAAADGGVAFAVLEA